MSELPYRIAVEDFIDSYQPIAAVIGPDQALALVKAYGGQRLYIPAVWRSQLEMNEIIGSDAARMFCDRFGPEKLEIPIMPYAASALRRIAAAMHQAGRTQNETARLLGVSYKTIRRSLAGSGPQKALTRRGRRVSDERQCDIEDWLKTAPKRA